MRQGDCTWQLWDQRAWAQMQAPRTNCLWPSPPMPQFPLTAPCAQVSPCSSVRHSGSHSYFYPVVKFPEKSAVFNELSINAELLTFYGIACRIPKFWCILMFTFNNNSQQKCSDNTNVIFTGKYRCYFLMHSALEGGWSHQRTELRTEWRASLFGMAFKPCWEARIKV